MRATSRLFATSGLVFALFASPAFTEDFHWQGRVAAGRAVEIKGVNGGIAASAAEGTEVVVTAHKKGRASDLDAVKIELVEHEGGVTICAVYPARSSSRLNECRPGDGQGGSNGKSDVEVDFTVRVPKGVRFVGRTVNGGIEAEQLPEEAEAYTVNGSVRVSAGGEARAETVNGSIRASMGRADGQGPLTFKTVNGGITVELPASAAASVHAETVNGSIETDFPLTVTGKLVGRRVDGVIGAGGRRLELETVNGSIALRKAS